MQSLAMLNLGQSLLFTASMTAGMYATALVGACGLVRMCRDAGPPAWLCALSCPQGTARLLT